MIETTEIIDRTNFLFLYITVLWCNNKSENKPIISQEKFDNSLLDLINNDSNIYLFLSELYYIDDEYNHHVDVHNDFDTFCELNILKKIVGTDNYEVLINDADINVILKDKSFTPEIINSVIYIYQKINNARGRY